MKQSFKIGAVLGALVLVGFACPTDADLETQVEDQIGDRAEEAVMDAVDEAVDEAADEVIDGVMNGDEAEDTVTVNYTDSGFDPVSLTVTSGTTVVWENNSSHALDVSSNPHPIHTSNRDLNAPTPVEPGSSYEFTFTEKGETGYHNHLRSSNKGTVTVE